MVPRASAFPFYTHPSPFSTPKFANTLDSTHICRGLALFWCKQDLFCPTTHRDASSSERGHTGPCLRSISLRLYTHPSIAQSNDMQSCYPHHHAVICSAQQRCNPRPAPHVLATCAATCEDAPFSCVSIVSLYFLMAIVLLMEQSSGRQSFRQSVNALSQGDMDTYVGKTRLHDASFPGQGIMRVDASHKGSSPVHQPQFNKAGPRHTGQSSSSPTLTGRSKLALKQTSLPLNARLKRNSGGRMFDVSSSNETCDGPWFTVLGALIERECHTGRFCWLAHPTPILGPGWGSVIRVSLHTVLHSGRI
jgi:hypothetical protein